MRESVIIKYNVLDDEEYADIDERNLLVDDTVADADFFDDEKSAYDIEYEVQSCAPNGDAIIKATFNYE